MKLGSLFSGVGGLELGLHWAAQARGIHLETCWQVEKEPYCRSVLARHWPEAERYTDVTTFYPESVSETGSHPEPVDLICGGFPCQDVSSAGKRVGLEGDRSGLWREFARIVRAFTPQWVVVENVASGAKLWVDRITGDLGRIGYATLPIPIEAASVGARHRRARIFVVAYLNRGHEHVGTFDAEMAGASESVADTSSLRRSAGLAEHRKWGRQEIAETGAPSDLDGRTLRDTEQRQPGGRPDRIRDGRIPFAQFPSWGSVEPPMVRTLHGVPVRVDGDSERRTSLGNSVVPQQAEVVGHVLFTLAETLGITDR